MKPFEEWPKEELVKELRRVVNEQDRVQYYGALSLPRKGEFPRLPGIDYFAIVEPYGGCVGGDYLAIIDFSKYQLGKRIKKAGKTGNDALAATLAKNLDRFGIAIGDVSGHGIAESVIVNFLHGSFRALVRAQIKQYGEVTSEFIEELNQELYEHVKAEYLKKRPYATFLYGEVHNDGRFRYVTSGHPSPIIFSIEHNRIEKIDKERTQASTPLGVFPSRYHVDAQAFVHSVDKVPVNEVHLLMPGDIMLLYTDGLTEQRGGELNFAEERLEDVLRGVKGEPARTVHDTIKRELFDFCPPDDDLTIAVIKKK
ncbi:MAG: PP2C family protein-serine/threonine phosphatase [Candidatus Aenigmatarchaeota archaeon]